MNKTNLTRLTIGMDLGDKRIHICILDGDGTIQKEFSIQTTSHALTRFLTRYTDCLVILEVGTHSPWISRLVESLGHEVIVANPRYTRAIYQNPRKNDRLDAEILARIGRMDPQLLKPVTHRDESAQHTLAMLQSRDQLIQTRTALVNHVRGSVKAIGHRLPKCTTETFHKHTLDELPEALTAALLPIMTTIGALTKSIRAYEKSIEETANQNYPETKILRQVRGVGPITALTYVLVVQDVTRFRTSRKVGAFLGLVPRLDQSGDTNRQLRITKAGDSMLRRYLTQSAQYILGPFGEDCDLQRHGLKIAKQGGKNGKRRAVTAVARKLAVLLHVLWKNQATYEPLKYSMPEKQIAA